MNGALGQHWGLSVSVNTRALNQLTNKVQGVRALTTALDGLYKAGEKALTGGAGITDQAISSRTKQIDRMRRELSSLNKELHSTERRLAGSTRGVGGGGRSGGRVYVRDYGGIGTSRADMTKVWQKLGVTADAITEMNRLQKGKGRLETRDGGKRGAFLDKHQVLSGMLRGVVTIPVVSALNQVRDAVARGTTVAAKTASQTPARQQAVATAAKKINVPAVTQFDIAASPRAGLNTQLGQRGDRAMPAKLQRQFQRDIVKKLYEDPATRTHYRAMPRDRRKAMVQTVMEDRLTRDALMGKEYRPPRAKGVSFSDLEKDGGRSFEAATRAARPKLDFDQAKQAAARMVEEQIIADLNSGAVKKRTSGAVGHRISRMKSQVDDFMKANFGSSFTQTKEMQSDGVARTGHQQIRHAVVAKLVQQGVIDPSAVKGRGGTFFSQGESPLGGIANRSAAPGTGRTGPLRQPRAHMGLGRHVMGAAGRVAQWGAGGMLVYGGLSTVRDGIRTMADFEQALTNVEKVINPLDADMGRLSMSAKEMGREFGQSIVEVGDAMTIYAQQGRGMEDIITQTRTAILATNVTQLGLVESTEALTAAQKQFRLSGRDSLRILDAWNEVENTTSVNARVLTESLKKAGTVARLAGIDFDTFNGISAAIGESTRKSGQEVGTALKFIFQNIYAPDSIEALQTAGIYTKDLMGNLRSGQGVLTELAGRWDTLTDSQRQNIGVSIAGVRRLNDFFVMMDTFDRATDIQITSLLSSGSAMRENEIAMESLRKQQMQLSASYETVWANLGEGGMITLLKQVNTGAMALTDTINGLAVAFEFMGGAAGVAVASAAAIGATALYMPAMDMMVPDARTSRKNRGRRHGLLGAAGARQSRHVPKLRQMGTGFGLMAGATLVGSGLDYFTGRDDGDRRLEGPTLLESGAGALSTTLGTVGLASMFTRPGTNPLRPRRAWRNNGRMGRTAMILGGLSIASGVVGGIGEQVRSRSAEGSRGMADRRLAAQQGELSGVLADLRLLEKFVTSNGTFGANQVDSAFANRLRDSLDDLNVTMGMFGRDTMTGDSVGELIRQVQSEQRKVTLEQGEVISERVADAIRNFNADDPTQRDNLSNVLKAVGLNQGRLGTGFTREQLQLSELDANTSAEERSLRLIGDYVRAASEREVTDLPALIEKVFGEPRAATDIVQDTDALNQLAKAGELIEGAAEVTATALKQLINELDTSLSRLLDNNERRIASSRNVGRTLMDVQDFRGVAAGSGRGVSIAARNSQAVLEALGGRIEGLDGVDPNASLGDQIQQLTRVLQAQGGRAAGGAALLQYQQAINATVAGQGERATNFFDQLVTAAGKPGNNPGEQSASAQAALDGLKDIFGDDRGTELDGLARDIAKATNQGDDARVEQLYTRFESLTSSVLDTILRQESSRISPAINDLIGNVLTQVQGEASGQANAFRFRGDASLFGSDSFSRSQSVIREMSEGLSQMLADAQGDLGQTENATARATLTRQIDQLTAAIQAIQPFVQDLEAEVRELATGEFIRANLNAEAMARSQAGGRLGLSGESGLVYAINALEREIAGLSNSESDNKRREVLNERVRSLQEQLSGAQAGNNAVIGGVRGAALNNAVMARMGLGGAGNPATTILQAVREQQMTQVSAVTAEIRRQLGDRFDSLSGSDLKGLITEVENLLGGDAIRQLGQTADPSLQKSYLLSTDGERALADSVQAALASGATLEQIFADPRMRAAGKESPLLQQVLDRNIESQALLEMVDLLDAIRVNTAPDAADTARKAIDNSFMTGTMAMKGTGAVDNKGRIRKDETPAMLHQGEIVLTKQQAEAMLANRYKSGTLSDMVGGFQRRGFASPTPADPSMLGDVLAGARSRSRGTFGMTGGDFDRFMGMVGIGVGEATHADARGQMTFFSGATRRGRRHVGRGGLLGQITLAGHQGSDPLSSLVGTSVHEMQHALQGGTINASRFTGGRVGINDNTLAQLWSMATDKGSSAFRQARLNVGVRYGDELTQNLSQMGHAAWMKSDDGVRYLSEIFADAAELISTGDHRAPKWFTQLNRAQLAGLARISESSGRISPDEMAKLFNVTQRHIGAVSRGHGFRGLSDLTNDLLVGGGRNRTLWSRLRAAHPMSAISRGVNAPVSLSGTARGAATLGIDAYRGVTGGLGHAANSLRSHGQAVRQRASALYAAAQMYRPSDVADLAGDAFGMLAGRGGQQVRLRLSPEARRLPFSPALPHVPLRERNAMTRGMSSAYQSGRRVAGGMRARAGLLGLPLVGVDVASNMLAPDNAWSQYVTPIIGGGGTSAMGLSMMAGRGMSGFNATHRLMSITGPGGAASRFVGRNGGSMLSRGAGRVLAVAGAADAGLAGANLVNDFFGDAFYADNARRVNAAINPLNQFSANSLLGSTARYTLGFTDADAYELGLEIAHREASIAGEWMGGYRQQLLRPDQIIAAGRAELQDRERRNASFMAQNAAEQAAQAIKTFMLNPSEEQRRDWASQAHQRQQQGRADQFTELANRGRPLIGRYHAEYQQVMRDLDAAAAAGTAEYTTGADPAMVRGIRDQHLKRLPALRERALALVEMHQELRGTGQRLDNLWGNYTGVGVIPAFSDEAVERVMDAARREIPEFIRSYQAGDIAESALNHKIQNLAAWKAEEERYIAMLASGPVSGLSPEMARTMAGGVAGNLNRRSFFDPMLGQAPLTDLLNRMGSVGGLGNSLADQERAWQEARVAARQAQVTGVQLREMDRRGDDRGFYGIAINNRLKARLVGSTPYGPKITSESQLFSALQQDGDFLNYDFVQALQTYDRLKAATTLGEVGTAAGDTQRSRSQMVLNAWLQQQPMRKHMFEEFMGTWDAVRVKRHSGGMIGPDETVIRSGGGRPEWVMDGGMVESFRESVAGMQQLLAYGGDAGMQISADSFLSSMDINVSGRVEHTGVVQLQADDDFTRSLAQQVADLLSEQGGGEQFFAGRRGQRIPGPNTP